MRLNLTKLKFYLCRACILGLVGSLPAAQEVLAAKLQPKTLKGWETYVRLTEQRIGAELEDEKRFLVTDFMSDTEAQTVRVLLEGGQVYIRKMETVNEDNRKINAKAGKIHHWTGCIFVPDVNVDSLLQWIQHYDNHYRYFKEVEQSKLLSREGETFHIFLRLRRKKLGITVVYNTEHMAVYRHHDTRRVSSRMLKKSLGDLLRTKHK